MIRFFDFLFSFLGILILSPILLVISVAIKLTSNGPLIYKQNRVGFANDNFKILKFRTMLVESDKTGLLTIGGRDPRVTSVGYYLRKFKLDELQEWPSLDPTAPSEGSHFACALLQRNHR